MLARIHRVLCAGALATAGVIACAPATSSSLRESRPTGSVLPLTPTSRVIDADRIRRSGSHTAWDAIRLLVPSFRFQSGRVSSLRTFDARDARQGESSTRLIIDGHQIRDFDALRTISAQEVIAIHLLSASEAATYFGPGSGGGAIVVQTRTSLRLR